VTHAPSPSLMRGAEDYRAGVPREACPFKGGADRVLWIRGYEMQRALCPRTQK
jgi:ribosome modulation factor